MAQTTSMRLHSRSYWHRELRLWEVSQHRGRAERIPLRPAKLSVLNI